METTTTKRKQGFASMSIEKRREIAARGGRETHRLGKAHRWSKEEARIAGHKGGSVSRGGGRRSRKGDK